MSVRSWSGKLFAALLTAGLTVGLSAASLPSAAAAGPGITNLMLTGGSLTAPVGKVIEHNTAYDLKGSTTFHMKLSFTIPEDADGRSYYTNWGDCPNFDWMCRDAFTLVDKNHVSNSYWTREPTIGARGPFSEDGTPTDLPVTIPAGITPGKYKLTMPIDLQYGDITNANPVVDTQNAVGYFTVAANPTNSRNTTFVELSGKKGPKTRIRVKAEVPSYQTGAKVTAYFKVKGAKKYTAVGTSKVTDVGYGSRVNFNLGKGKIRKAGIFFLRFGAVRYSAGYDGRTRTIK